MEEAAIVGHWRTPYTNVYVSLAGFTIFHVSIKGKKIIIMVLWFLKSDL